ncbi:MAG: ABC transporter substrate-binding protein [Synergistaceae bacterium]|jgi:branched-chain amino acid transport system substrate-binding protein|nr:ABC transporter substrate-binding protein [Synergistaceae bacterium]
MDDRLVGIAGELVKMYGNLLLEDPDRLGHLLEDRCGEARREIFVLCFALREVLKDGGLPKPGTFPANSGRVASRLCENLGFSKKMSEWAVSAVQELIELGVEAEESFDTRMEAHRGFLPYISDVIAKRPRTMIFRKKTLRNGMLLLGIMAVFLGLFVRITESVYTPSNEISVLFLAHLSGPDAPAGHVRLKAAQMAADQINAAGGVKGRMIRIRAHDVPLSEKDALFAADELLRARDSAAAISVCKDPVNEVLAQAADVRETPLLASESSVLPVTMASQDRPRLYSFRMNYDSAYKGRIAAYFLTHGLKRSSPALIYEAYSADSSDARSSFIESMNEYGGAAVCEVTWTKLGGVDRASVEEIKSSGADSAVILNDYPDAGAVVANLRRYGYEGVIIGLALSDAMISSAGRDIDDSWWVVPAHPDDPQLQSFQAAYRDKYNENISRNDFFGTLFAYDAVRWVADVMFRAPGFQGEALRHSFMSTKNLALSHATLTVDPRTHGPWNKAAALVYCSDGSDKFQRRFRPQ